jgi:anti-sigma B factor antagonist
MSGTVWDPEDVGLEIGVDRHDGYVVLSPRGEIDFVTGPQLEHAITGVLAAGDLHVVIDLTGVDFLESTGLAALIGGRRRALALDGSLSLVGAGEQLVKVFRITGLDTLFPLHDTVAAALAGQPAAEVGTSGLAKQRLLGDHA